MPDNHECHCCGGTGRIELTGVYLETLQNIRCLCKTQNSYVVANADWKHLGAPSVTALNNRLTRLEELGYLWSERFGRQRRFHLTHFNPRGQYA